MPGITMRSLLLVICVIGGCVGMMKESHAHAMHPDSMDRHAGITFTPGKLILIYQAICGLNPTESYSRKLDPDNDGTITDEERTVFIKIIAETYAKNQVMKLGEQDVSLQFHSGDAYASVGHNGMNVIKVDIAYTAAYPTTMPRSATQSFLYEDNNFKSVPGWKQMQVSACDGVVYDGYVPYQEFKPFDYEIINTKGFTPSTEKVTGTVNIPPVADTVTTAILLPDKTERKEVMLRDNWIMLNVVYGLAVVLVIIVLLIGYRAVMMNR